MKRFNVVMAVVMLLICSSVGAQPSGASGPDFGAGEKRAAVCFACHNPDGISKIPGVPHLAGQERTYLEKALHAYREGQQRQDPTMTAMAKPLSDADIINIAAYFSLQARMNNGQTAAQMQETLDRIRPVGYVTVEAAPIGTSNTTVAQSTRSGEAVFQSVCTACHSTGAAGAPKIGDKTAWSPRIAQGERTLLQHALQGFNAMPARGTCAACSDGELKAAVDYLVAKAK